MSKKKSNASKVKNGAVAVFVSLMLHVVGQSPEPGKPEMSLTGNQLFHVTVINGNVINGNVTITSPSALAK